MMRRRTAADGAPATNLCVFPGSGNRGALRDPRHASTRDRCPRRRERGGGVEGDAARGARGSARRLGLIAAFVLIVLAFGAAVAFWLPGPRAAVPIGSAPAGSAEATTHSTSGLPDQQRTPASINPRLVSCPPAIAARRRLTGTPFAIDDDREAAPRQLELQLFEYQRISAAGVVEWIQAAATPRAHRLGPPAGSRVG